jgi:hypothetical protein
MEGWRGKSWDYWTEDGEGFGPDVPDMMELAEKIDRAKCASYYREHFVRTGEFPLSSWKDACTSNRFFTSLSERAANRKLRHVAPHLMYCEGQQGNAGYAPMGVVRLRPESVFSK